MIGVWLSRGPHSTELERRRGPASEQGHIARWALSIDGQGLSRHIYSQSKSLFPTNGP